MNNQLKLIAFDGDDTLWGDMPFYHEAIEKIAAMLREYAHTNPVQDVLCETETENLSIMGYGSKTFLISVLEAAIKVSDHKIQVHEILEIIRIGKSLMNHPIRLLPDVKEVLTDLASDYRLMLITKGDISEQKSKIYRSGLSDCFRYIEIVNEKDEQTYSEILKRYDVAPENFLMIGNSLRSDIIPVLNIGGNAVHIPYEVTWYHEEVSEDIEKEYSRLSEIRELPGLIGEL